jgi:short-subunit dehydrogenase
MTEERIWLIGASEGIGAALARRLAAEGHVCAVTARSADRLSELCLSLPGSGHLALPADVGDVASLAAVHARLIESWGHVDTMVYCAGTYDPMAATHMKLTRVEAMIDTNLTGAFRAVASVLPDMLQRAAGRIVLMGSVAGYRGLGSAMGYGASKAGINHLAENLRLDLAASGVRVQLVCPGFVRTRLTDKNSFGMPFLMDADKAADLIARGLRTRRFEIHFPKRLSLFLKALSVLPAGVYFPLVERLLGKRK